MQEAEQLLRAYVAEGSEAAFQELVGRYINLVYSVAVRRIGGDSHRAEDIVQTVFTDLARKAHELPSSVMLGGWLHRHCCFVASTVARTESRRHAREIKAMKLLETAANESASWEELAPVLDEAIQSLEPGDRDAITLRYFEGRNLRSVGDALGTSEDTAQKRVSRAVEKLRLLLTARGVALTTAALGALLETNSVKAAPVEWAGRVSANALKEVPSAGALSALSAFLLTGAGKFAVALSIIALGIGAVTWTNHQRNKESSVAPQRFENSANLRASLAAQSFTKEQVSNSLESSSEKIAEKTSPHALRLKVLSAQSGDPIRNGSVEYRARTESKASRTDLLTDQIGECVAELPTEKLVHVEITTRIPGYADTRLSWYPANGETIPDSYTVRLEKGLLIGGTVVNEQGEPVPHAKVGFNVSESGERGNKIESHNFQWMETETDSDGRWRLDRMGADILKEIFGMATHPEYVPSSSVALRQDAAAERALRDQTHIFTLRKGMVIQGVVLDENRNPIPNAAVLAGNRGEVGSRETQTGLDGSFELKGVRPGASLITAQAAQYAPATREMTITTNTPPIELVLRSGKILRLHVISARGEPIAGANVWLDNRSSGPTSASQPLAQADFSPKTDRDGRVFWDQAPPGQLGFSIEAKGYMRRDDIKVEADGKEHEIVLQDALHIHGTVRDAEKNTPISAFRIVTGWPKTMPMNDKVTAQWSDLDRFTVRFSNGQFDHTFEEPVIVGAASNLFMLKLAAPGYSPFISRVINADEHDVTLDVQLNPASAQHIRVLQPNGQPAARADLVFATPLRIVQLGDGSFSRQAGPIDAVTDEHGETDAQPEDGVLLIYVAHQSGFAEVQPSTLQQNPVIQLQRWGHLAGRYTKHGKPVSQTRMVLRPVQNATNNARALLMLEMRPLTDQDGRFDFPRVPAIRWQLAYLVRNADAHSSHDVPLREVNVQPGETLYLDVVESGADIVARVQLPPGAALEKGDKMFALIHTPFPNPPSAIREDNAALRAWRMTPEIDAQFRTVKSWTMHPTADGTYKAETVPPGNYQANFTVGRISNSSELFSADVPLTVPDSADGETIDLGTILLQNRSTSQARK